MRYEFKYFETDISGKETGNQMSTSFHADTLDQMLEKFEYFLKGSGFHFDGKIDIVEDQIEDQTPSEKRGIGVTSAHSPYYYDLDRNRPFGEWHNYTAGSNDWDTGAAQPTLNVDLSDSFVDNYEIKIDSSNVFYTQFDTMAGYPHER